MGKLNNDDNWITSRVCKNHPKYKGRLNPRVNCEECWRIYFIVQDYLKWEAEMSYESPGR